LGEMTIRCKITITTKTLKMSVLAK
jgi:hypothetical protein